MAHNGLGLSEEAELEAQNLIRSTQFKFSTNCHTKNVCPNYAKPLL